MDSKFQIVNSQHIGQDAFDAIPVLASNGVPNIECPSCLAAMIKVEEEKNKNRTPGTRISSRISKNKLQVFTDQECMHNLYLDIAENDDLLKVSWPRIKPEWVELFTAEYYPVYDYSNISRKRKITEDSESTPPKKKIAIEVIELE